MGSGVEPFRAAHLARSLRPAALPRLAGHEGAVTPGGPSASCRFRCGTQQRRRAGSTRAPGWFAAAPAGRTSPGRPARGSRTPRQPSAVPSIGPLPNAAVAAGLLLADGPSAAPDHSTETDQTSSPSTARSSSVGQQRHRFDQRSTFRSTLLTASATGQQPRGQNDCSTVLLWLSTLRRPARATPARQLITVQRPAGPH